MISFTTKSRGKRTGFAHRELRVVVRHPDSGRLAVAVELAERQPRVAEAHTDQKQPAENTPLFLNMSYLMLVPSLSW